MEFILLFFLGATLGSFYHVVGFRMPIGENFINDRSRCPSCSKQLKFYELIPIVSYMYNGENAEHVMPQSSPFIYYQRF